MNFNLFPLAKGQHIVDQPTGIVNQYFFNWLNALFKLLQGTIGSGFTGTITTAKLTDGGANGSMTFVNGVVTSQTPAT
jgi:hypothetical protein